MGNHVLRRLLPQVSIVTDEHKIGILMDVWARDNVQAALLREIRAQLKTVDAMKWAAQAIRDGPCGDAFDALALVDLILTFGNVINSK